MGLGTDTHWHHWRRALDEEQCRAAGRRVDTGSHTSRAAESRRAAMPPLLHHVRWRARGWIPETLWRVRPLVTARSSLHKLNKDYLLQTHILSTDKALQGHKACKQLNINSVFCIFLVYIYIIIIETEKNCNLCNLYSQFDILWGHLSGVFWNF